MLKQPSKKHNMCLLYMFNTEKDKCFYDINSILIFNPLISIQVVS